MVRRDHPQLRRGPEEDGSGAVAMIHYDDGEKKKLRPTTAKGGCEREAEPALFGELRLRRAARRPSQQRFNVLPKPTGTGMPFLA